MTPAKKFLWPHELGREVGISSATVRRLADSGVVEVIRDAKGRRRFKPEAIGILRRTLGLEEVIEGAGTNHDHTANTVSAAAGVDVA